MSIKIFNAVIKYWLRLHESNNPLLVEALILNKKQNGKNKQNWTRMASNLLAITNISESPSKNPSKNNKFLSTFKLKIKQCFDLWWQGKRNNEGKLDFYFKYKKFFKYEEYLDFLPRHIRRFMTRLRTSSHNFPIEILRCGKKQTKKRRKGM